MEKKNYQREMEKIIERVDVENPPTLLLHSCCGPCSSYVLEYLSQYLKITIFYYNPNIYPDKEYFRRLEEQKEVIEKIEGKNPIALVEGEFDTSIFYNTIKGLEKSPEGSHRCFKCYELRLKEAAILAKKMGFDYFTTTLTISPHKNSGKLNEIGLRLAEEYGISYLVSDFKKKGGYKRSVEFTKENNLYRQEYCGCVYSIRKQ